MAHPSWPLESVSSESVVGRGGNHANAPAYKKGDADKKKKTNKDKVYMLKDDSGSKMATTALDHTKLGLANDTTFHCQLT